MFPSVVQTRFFVGSFAIDFAPLGLYSTVPTIIYYRDRLTITTGLEACSWKLNLPQGQSTLKRRRSSLASQMTEHSSRSVQNGTWTHFGYWLSRNACLSLRKLCNIRLLVCANSGFLSWPPSDVRSNNDYFVCLFCCVILLVLKSSESSAPAHKPSNTRFALNDVSHWTTDKCFYNRLFLSGLAAYIRSFISRIIGQLTGPSVLTCRTRKAVVGTIIKPAGII
jgi:hypothetical protein